MMPAAQKAPTILVIDCASELFREALSMLVLGIIPDAAVLTLGCEAHANLPNDRDHIDLVLLKLDPPIMDGLNLLRQLRRSLPLTPILLISGTHDANMIATAFSYGASGFVHTQGGIESLSAAIHEVQAGKSVLPEDGTAQGRHACYQLSIRQKDVLRLICMGMSNKEIGLELRISDNTVRTHVSAILKILAVNNRAEAMILGRQLFIGESEQLY